MRKRTRIAVVAAALLLGVVAPTVAAVGNGQAAEAGLVSGEGAAFQRLAPSARYLLSGKPPVELSKSFEAAGEIARTIPITRETSTGEKIMLTVEEHADLVEIACNAADTLGSGNRSSAQWLLGQQVQTRLSALQVQRPWVGTLQTPVLDMSQRLGDAGSSPYPRLQSAKDLICKTNEIYSALQNL
jgi:hypothetical protein